MEKNQPLCGKCGTRLDCAECGLSWAHGRAECSGFVPAPCSCQEPSGKEDCWACENRGRLCEKHAGAYQEVPTPSAPTPGEDWEAKYEDILHGTNPAIIWGTRRIEWKDILDQGVFSAKFNALYDLFLSLSSRESKAREEGRKEGAVEQWEKDRAAVDKCPQYLTVRKDSMCRGWINEELDKTNPKKL